MGSCAGQPPNGSGRSPSVMFIIYMVIGFTATLTCIMILTLLYFIVRQAPTFAYLCGQPFLQACTDPKNGSSVHSSSLP